MAAGDSGRGSSGATLRLRRAVRPSAIRRSRSAKEKRLTDALGRGVRLVGGEKKGRITLEFYSADDREALMNALMKMEKPWKEDIKGEEPNA